LIQAISNLLSNNAVKFTKDGGGGGGTIAITTEKKVTQAIVKVKDTHTGIDSEILPQLLSKFVSKSFEGTELGLFIAKNIVEAHDGKIWVENNNINTHREKGDTFYFTLPTINRQQRNVKVFVDQ
jgi:signal transduction histidine kinase